MIHDRYDYDSSVRSDAEDPFSQDSWYGSIRQLHGSFIEESAPKAGGLSCENSPFP